MICSVRRRAPFVVVLVLGFGPGAASADAPAVRLDLEAGSELDTNVHRDVGVGGPAGGRLTARGAISWRASLRHALRVRAVAAVKAFGAPTEASEENVALVSGDARWEARITDTLGWTGIVSYYDSIETHSSTYVDRDFRTGDAAGGLTLLADRGHRVSVNAGYRLFAYKPNSSYDFSGPHAGLTWRKAWQADEDDPIWDLSFSYNAHQRRYGGEARINSCPPDQDVTEMCLDTAGFTRVDLFHAAAVELTWTSTRILGARYELQIDDSNSFGESFIRHRFDLSATTELPRDVFLTAKVVLQFSDDLLFGCDECGDLTGEDDTRNAFILHFTREVGAAWMLEARAAYFTDAFTPSSQAYRRGTIYLGAIYTFRSGS
jgi:hypothetical protein